VHATDPIPARPAVLRAQLHVVRILALAVAAHAEALDSIAARKAGTPKTSVLHRTGIPIVTFDAVGKHGVPTCARGTYVLSAFIPVVIAGSIVRREKASRRLVATVVSAWVSVGTGQRKAAASPADARVVVRAGITVHARKPVSIRDLASIRTAARILSTLIPIVAQRPFIDAAVAVVVLTIARLFRRLRSRTR